MSARRLNDNEKKEIVNLYRESSETAMSLAEQYGVSNTTISRILKAGIESSEYDRLIQQKRRGGDAATLEITIPVLEAQQPTVEVQYTAVKPQVVTAEAPEEAPFHTHPIDETMDSTPSGRRIRRRTTVEPQSLEPIALPPIEKEIVLAYPVFSTQSRPPLAPPLAVVAPETLQETPAPFEASNKPVRKVIQVGVAKRSLEPETLDDDDDDILPPVTEEMAAILEEDFDEDDEDDDQDDDDPVDDEDDEELEAAPALHVQQFMQVLPLDQASIPRVCYLVVDRSADLVLRPLKDFGDMGQVPPGRDQVLTLPIFDNPRVAKRFANARTERVIKIPDSQIFYKTADKLLAKGITYLYIDGQLYSL